MSSMVGGEAVLLPTYNFRLLYSRILEGIDYKCFVFQTFQLSVHYTIIEMKNN